MADDQKRPSLFAQLKQRRVVRAAIAYAAAAFVVLQLADILFPPLGVPDWAFRLLVVVTLVGFPVALVLAWVFELTPEGVRLATAEGRLVARFRPRVIYAAGFVLVLVLIGASVFWIRPRLLSGEVAPGADVIAVMPFRASGASVEAMSDGLVDLLSRNLDEVGAIRTVDPRTVLHRWQEHAGDGDVPGDEVLQIARELSAGSVLTGSVVAAGGGVRITADLLALDGSRIATVSVNGEEHEVLALVDSLSVALLREIWRGRGATPTVDIAAISTSNLTAIRSFLAGERHFRASDWTWAVEAFERAIEADSTFALAYYRLSRASGWTSRAPHTRDWYVEMASRYADRLPGRTRGLLTAERLILDEDRDAAIDTLRALTRRYPDDPEVWQALADNQYHVRDEGQFLAARPLDEQLRAFDRVLELDPSFVPATIHPLEVSFLYGDTARIDRYLEILRDVSSVSGPAVRIVEDARAALGQPDDLVGLTSALSVVLQTLEKPQTDLRWQMAKAAHSGLRRVAATQPAEGSAVIVEWLRARLEEGDPDFGPWALHTLLDVLIASGRLREAHDVMMADFPEAQLSAAERDVYRALPVLGGYVRSELGLDDPETDYGEELAAVARMILTIDRAEPDRVVEAARTDSSRADGEGPGGRAERAEALEQVASGFATALRGDASKGLDRIEQALDAPTPLTVHMREALWFRWLLVAAAHTESRERALTILRRPWPGTSLYDVRRSFLLGQALEAIGESEDAARAYERFARILAAADEGIAIQADAGAALHSGGGPL